MMRGMHAGTPALGEWLETDGIGGYAMGTADGVRRRRYHGLLTTALAAPVRRVMLVAGVDAWVTGPSGRRLAHRQLQRRSLAALYL